VEILVVTPHTDDFIYGVGGTLITHADDDIHIVAVSSIQQTAARDVAAAFGATIEFLDAPYHRISDHAHIERLLVQQAEADRGRRQSLGRDSGVTPEALQLDMPLQVRFEPRGDVSLPVFGPVR